MDHLFEEFREGHFQESSSLVDIGDHVVGVLDDVFVEYWELLTDGMELLNQLWVLSLKILLALTE